jgi:hypothetical protein
MYFLVYREAAQIALKQYPVLPAMRLSEFSSGEVVRGGEEIKGGK